MTYPNQAADSLHVLDAGAEVRELTAVGTIPGVAPLLAAARNAPGAGRLRATGAGATLQYKAPDSAAWGNPQPVVDGLFLLTDGDDPDAFLRVQVAAAFLHPGPAEGRVLLADRYQNGVCLDDVTAGEALLGDVSTYTLSLENASTVTISALVVWLDAATAGIEISDDGTAWVSPTTEETALAFADLAPAASHTLHLRRTIAASAPSDPEVLDVLHIRFHGL